MQATVQCGERLCKLPYSVGNDYAGYGLISCARKIPENSRDNRAGEHMGRSVWQLLVKYRKRE